MFSFGSLAAQSGQALSITGTVTGGEGEPLIGATITVSAGVGTVTDLDGNYHLTAPADGVLTVTYTGYGTKQVQINNRTQIDIELDDMAVGLTEVVVVGYGSQRRKDLTGAVVSAPIEAFREAPNTNILQSLNGTIPGVTVGQATSAGADPGFSIRGQTSINGTNVPLIIVDGVIYRGRITDINPNDVQSVDVLKDVSSKAIYGAQGANGVILITTKGGRSNRKPQISYSGSFTTQNPSVDRRLLGREGYLDQARAVDYQNGFLGPEFTQINPDFSFQNDVPFFGPVVEGIANGTDFDWLDASRQNGYITDHTISVSGGGENSTYFLSGGYTDQQGVILNDNYNRISARANIDVDVTDWLTIGLNSFGSFSDFSGDSPEISDLTKMSPVVNPRDENGNFIVNPLGDNILNPLLASSRNDLDLRNRISGIAYAKVEIPFIPGLSYRVNYSNNYRFSNRSQSDPFGGGLNGRAFKNNATNYDWTLNNIFTYKARLGVDHSLTATAIIERNRIREESTFTEGIGFTNLNLGYNSLEQANDIFTNSSAYEESYSSQAGRLAYGYKSRYLLTGTVRRDGYSGFAFNNRSAVFPSVSVGWVLSEENFMAENSLFDFLKLRVGYGTSGNTVGRYSSLARIASGNDNRYVFGDGGTSVSGQSISTLANPNLSWERTTGANFGVDFSILDSRISGNIDYYVNTTNDLLFDLRLPSVTGFDRITSNVGEVDNKGIEILLNTAAVRTESFSWDIAFNFARNRNEIVSLIGGDQDGDGVEDDLTASGLFIGEPIGTIFDYEVTGVYQVGDEDIPDGFQPGSYRIADVNGDGMITADDRKVLGAAEPGYSFGIRNTLSYGDFTLRIFINSVQGGDNYYLSRNEPVGVITSGLAQNQNAYADIDFWSTVNPAGYYRLPGTNARINGSRYAVRSFVRLQDISLAYSVNQKVLERIGVENIKLFVSGKNLVTLTDWEGWDPETGQGLSGGLPLLRGFSFGLNTSF